MTAHVERWSTCDRCNRRVHGNLPLTVQDAFGTLIGHLCIPCGRECLPYGVTLAGRDQIPDWPS